MRSRPRILVSLMAVALIVSAILASFFYRGVSAQAPSAPDNSFPGVTTSPVVKSQLWINDGTWWGVFSDGSSGLYIYQRVGNSFVKGALVDPNVLGMPDTLWDGTNLYVIVLEGQAASEAKLYKYSYSVGTMEYFLEPGFPVSLPLTGLGMSAVIAKDATGKLWVTYAGAETGAGGDGSIHVIWSITPDHLSWDTSGTVLETGAANVTEAATIVAFNDGAPKVGVLWSNQTLGQYGFRYHLDGDLESTWSTKEIVDSNGAGGSISSEYMSIQAAPDGRVLALGEDQIGTGHINLYVRSTAGTWSPRMPANPDVNSQPSRPILLLDTENNFIYCVFRDSTYNKSTFFTKTSLTSPGTFQPATILISNKANDGTSTKQHLNSATDLIAAASQDGDIFWNIIDLSAPPSASFQGTPGSGTAPLPVSFVDTSSDDGGIVSWNWNFGDGFTSTQQHPSHVFRAGTWNVTLQVADAAGNIATTNQSITVADAGNPVIQAIAPAVVNIGAVIGDFTLIVDGAAFVNGAVVQFNGANRTTTFVSATRVTATITLADVSAVGQFPITVTLPSSAVSNAMNLTVSGDNPAPAITTITPTTTTSSSPAFDLTINGTGFVASSKVWVNGTERLTVYVSPTQLKTNIGATDLALPLYQIPVWVVNTPPGGGTSNTAFFDITPACTAPTAPISFVADHQFNSVHSALWYNDGSWWGALSDRTTGTYIWQHNNNQFVKGAQIGTNSLAGPDTLWDGTNLFILSYETSSLGKFYKYSYDSVSKTYSLLAGFPVDIPLTGLASSLTFTKDSTGKIWAAYTGTNNNDGIGDGKLHVIWTTSPDHLGWDTAGTVLETGLSVLLTETAAISNFGGNRIGVAWSNQGANEVAFKFHNDADLESTWSLKEVVDSGASKASEYINLKGTPDGRVFLAQIDNIGNRRVNLFRRNAGGTWDPKIPVTRNPIAKPKNVVVAFADTINEVFVMYRDSGNGSAIYGSHMNGDSNLMPAGCPVISSSASDPSSTKQSVSGSTGLGVTATGSNQLFTVVQMPASPPPTITSVLPGFKTAGEPDFLMTVTGTNFDSGSIVRFNGNNRTTTFVNSTELTAQILAADIASGGQYSITVSSGGLVSSAFPFSVDNPLPTLTSIVPTQVASNGPAFTLTATGTNFTPASVLRFNAVARPVTFVNSTQVSAQIAAAEIVTPGAVPVEIFNPGPGGGVSFVQTFTIVNSGPIVNTLTPSSVTTGGAAFTLTVDGSNFTATSAVRWNGADRPTTFVSSTQLTASITAADISTGGAIPISVIAGPGGIVSNIINFTVNNPAPQITGITPSPVSVSGAAFTLTVNGTGFVPNSVVRINGDLPANERQTVFVNATQLTASITAADIAATGTFPITVFNPLPSGGVSNAVNLTVNDPLPTIASLSPASVTAGAVDFPLTVNGSNFVTGAVVRLNGTNATTTFVSATQLTTTVPAASVANAGTLNVTVRNPSGGTSDPAPLAISNPVPILTSLSPASKTAGDAGFTLIANGSNFNTTSVLRINGTDRVTTLVSTSQLSTPLTALDIATAGNRTVTVFNPAPGGGTSSSVDLVVNNPLPAITNLTPTNLLQGSPQTIVAITGTGFVSGSVVSWKGENRTTSFVSSTQLNVEITANDLNVSGPANITVANPSPGGGTSNAMAFTVNANPRILKVLDASGFAGGSATVTVQLAAQGDENALGFTLYFDPAVLSNPIASVGPDASAATLNGNSSQVAQGHYGVVLSLPAGMTFSPGTENVATVTFSVASVPSGTLTQVSFGDLPVTREVADIVAEVLPTAFVAGTLTLTTGVESDVAPRPNGSGNGTVTVSDWVQVGRFVSGIDSASTSAEFQRADCAPRASLGNGSMTVSDWVQAGRYAAGLDPVVPAGGPNSPPAGAPDSKDFESAQGGSREVETSSQARAVRLNLLEQVGQERTVAISLDAFGAENGVGFSLMFDPSKLEFVSATNGADAQAATLQVNKAGASRGRLGFALALPTGQSFSEGSHQVVVLKFVVLDRLGGRADLNFTDFPVTRELVAENASILKVDFQNIPGRESNPIDDPQYFVYRQYVDLLGRQPDAGGLDYWTSQITACGSDELCINRRRVAVSDAFLFEREFHETGAFIIRAYKAALVVTPTFQQFSQDRESVVGGLAINENKGRFAVQLTDSAEFSRLYPITMNPARYVEALDLNAGRVLDDLQKQELTRSLAAGRDSRASVLLRIAELPTFADREYNSAFVLMQYFGYLQRDPDPEGYRFWLGQLDRFALRDVSAQHGLVCSFITSSEYQSRFGSQISRSNADCGR